MIGLIVFANESGLGYQTRRLCQLIRPDRILLIDSSSFSKNKIQHYEWYDGFNGYRVNGFPTNHEIRVFLEGLTHVFCAENALNNNLTAFARKKGIKVFIQTNYEFCDFLREPSLVLPYKFVMPSFWKVEEMEQAFGKDNVLYLPPPIDPRDFDLSRDANYSREVGRKFLHTVGTLAVHDRNGTLDLLQALQYTKSEFELVITSQQELPQEYLIDDRRVRYVMDRYTDPADLYKDFDALILPRRYGGLCLPCNEALMAGLPVIMTDCSPNNELLPSDWLMPATVKDSFQARVPIDVYTTSPREIAKKIDWLVDIDQKELGFQKLTAFDLGHTTFAFSSLKRRYRELWEL